MSNILIYNDKSIEVKTIISNDAIMANLINHMGEITMVLREDYFESLARIVIGQQLSAYVARLIWQKLKILCVEITPYNILSLEEKCIADVGVSKAKMKCLKDLASHVVEGTIDLNSLKQRSNQHAIISKLTKIKGIGPWTAEMFMIFSLGKLNILSLNDIGLQRAVQWLYALNSNPTPTQISRIGEKWEPYQTIASLYLWKCIDNNYINKEGFKSHSSK